MRSFLLGEKTEVQDLPYDYEVEYIEGTGIQYVGVVVNVPVDAQYEFRVRAMPTASGAGWLLASGSGSFGRQGPAVYGPKWYIAAVTIDTNNPIDITLNNDGSWYGGVQKIDGSFVDAGATRNITMMCRSDLSATYRFIGRVYGLEIDLNGALVRKLVPCVKDGVPCFYDSVSKTFYNDLSGEGFISGPRKEVA